jgi:BNR repeat-like domain
MLMFVGGSTSIIDELIIPRSAAAAATTNIDSISMSSLGSIPVSLSPFPSRPNSTNSSSNPNAAVQISHQETSANTFEATLSNNIANTSAFYVLKFRSDASGVISKIVVEFPVGTDITKNRLMDQSGIDASTTIANTTTLTINVNNPKNGAPGAPITLMFGGIINPSGPGDYQVTMTALDPSGNVIVGPLDSTPYNIKSLLADDIFGVSVPWISLDFVYLVWVEDIVDNLDERTNIMFKRNIVSFDPAEAIGIDLGFNTEPEVAALRDNVHVVWENFFPIVPTIPMNNDDSGSNIKYARSTDGGASFGNAGPDNLSNHPRGDFSLNPAVAVGNDVHVVWEYSAGQTGSESKLEYTRSTDGGATFTDPVNLDTDNADSYEPAIAASGNNVYVAWSGYLGGNYEIFYTRSTDGGATFTDPVNLSVNNANSYAPAIANSGNNLYIVWQDYASSSPRIAYTRSTDGGATFTDPVNLDTDNADSYEPAIAASGNNVYVVWSDLERASSEVLYRNSRDAGEKFGSTINLSNTVEYSFSPGIAVAINPCLCHLELPASTE